MEMDSDFANEIAIFYSVQIQRERECAFSEQYQIGKCDS